MTSDRIAALRRTALFGSLGDEELRALASRSLERKLAREETLFVAGEEARWLYVIVTGSVRAFRSGPEGREQVIHTERAGATLAEVPIFDNGTYPATAVADEDSVVLSLSREDVRIVCREQPNVAFAALELLAGRLRRHAELVEVLSLRAVGQRLAQLLLKEARVRGEKTDAGTGFDIAATNAQLAARVGTVTEVVSRTLSRLDQDGLIIINSRRVTIPDEELLAAYAGDN